MDFFRIAKVLQAIGIEDQDVGLFARDERAHDFNGAAVPDLENYTGRHPARTFPLAPCRFT